MAKGKTTQNNTVIEPLPKSCHWSDWMAPEAFRLFPEKEAWRKRLALTMLMWYEDKDENNEPVLDIMDFCIQYKISGRTLRHYKLTYADIKDTYNDVKELLGYRRRVGVYRKKLDTSIFKDMHTYDPEWLEINKYNADLKNTEDAQVKHMVVLRQTPNNSKVPERKK